MKILWHDGLGMSLYAKRLDRGKFIWPSASRRRDIELGAKPGPDHREPVPEILGAQGLAIVQTSELASLSEVALEASRRQTAASRTEKEGLVLGLRKHLVGHGRIDEGLPGSWGEQELCGLYGTWSYGQELARWSDRRRRDRA
ncbi:IS66 family insertion sequence element accessory protein TnpB [Bradyrhizobium arachidis]|uniref:IS66 family insertion sequence element accessory protein TnpB n=1 Tax=Bradyrhizobium arachidis TaxID=858423 RepID=UPI0038D11C7E